ncbi:MAG: DUF4347 domain-containing protein, partial [Pseudomonadota bacterium]
MLSRFGRIFRRDSREMVMPQEAKPLMRVLEPRVLLDAAGMETASDMADAAGVHAGLADDYANELAAAPEAPARPAKDLARDMVFVDGSVENLAELLSEIDPSAEVHVLDLSSDGVEQIAAVLDGRTDLAAIHIFSHGDSGVLNLGSGSLTGDTITTSHVQALTRIGASLAEGGDILIYGCDFGAGEAGRAAAAQLAAVTGADIAASDDLTGSVEKGGDWDLEVVQGDVETGAYKIEGFKGILAAFELGTNADPTITLADTRTLPANNNGVTVYGGVGSVAVWENAGEVTLANGTTQLVDVVATVTGISDNNTGVYFGTRGTGGTDAVDDFRIIIVNDHNFTADPNDNAQVRDTGTATIRWQIFEAGTNQTVEASDGEVGLTISDIDGRDGTPATREAIGAELATLSSYTVQAGTNLFVDNDGTYIFADGTQDQNDEEASWVRYNWDSVSSLTMVYRTQVSNAYFHHDGDGDLVFTNPNTAFATGIDLDSNDSSGATGSSYQTVFFSDATTGVPVEIADGDIDVQNAGNRATSATITLTNAYDGDELVLNTALLTSLGITGTVTTVTPGDATGGGEIRVDLTGAASTQDYQSAIQSIAYNTTNIAAVSDLTPGNPYINPRSIDVQVFDGTFASGVANTAVTFNNIANAPTATRDLYVTNEDTTLAVPFANGLLSNDTDAVDTPASMTVSSAVDAAGTAITINAVGAASPTVHTLAGATPALQTQYPGGVGQLTLFADGSFDFVPTGDFSGTAFFNYTVTDSGGFTASSYASINVQGVADTPNVPTFVSSVANEDAPSAIVDITATQGDADGSETLRYAVSGIPSGYSFTDGTRVVTSSALTDVFYLDDWDVDQVQLLQPALSNHSDVDVVLQLTVTSTEPNGDTTSASNSIVFNYAAVADAPVLSLMNGSAGPGALMNLPPLIDAQLTDTDGSETLVEYRFSNIPAGASLWDGGTQLMPVGGVVTVLAADFPGVRLLTPNTLGSYSLDVEIIAQETNAQDDVAVFQATSGVQTLNFTVDNVDDPIDANDDTYTVFAGQTALLSPIANDDVPDGGPQIITIDGQAVSAGDTITLTSGAGTVTLNPNGSLTFVASNTLSGQTSFTYELVDALANDPNIDPSDTATITIDAPTWRLTGDTTVAEGGAAANYSISLDAVPPAGTPISVDISAIEVDTTAADHDDIVAAIQAAADANPNFTF